MNAFKFPILAAAAMWSAASLPATAVPAASGRPVPELTDLDDMMTNYMDANAITAGVLGLMQDGRIVYLRGFGEDYNGDDLPENALMRVASLSKPLTAACIRRMAADGVIDLADNAFDLGQPGGGILDYDPWPSVGDNRFQNITVNHLLNHQGGWDHDTDNDGTFENPDWTYREVTVANTMQVASPPGRVNIMRFVLGQPLQLNPGTGSGGATYSNANYITLGLIAEQESGQSLISYIRQNILTPRMWVPGTEILAGRTFRASQDPREPRYDDPTLVTNVYDTEGAQVERPYGGWGHENRVGEGNIVISAAAMLAFADTYRSGYAQSNIGQPLDDFPLVSSTGHNGAMPGGSTSYIRQRTDGYRIFLAFNKRGGDGTVHANVLGGAVDSYLDNNVIPTIHRTSDGFWTEPSGGAGTDVGGFHQPFHSFASAMAKTTAGSKIRLKPGTSDWTGKISKRTRLDAPLGGVAKIGL